MDCIIRKLKKTDLYQIKQLQPEGWQDITYYFDMYTDSGSCIPLCATKDRNIIAVGNAIILEESGWLSHIIVAKEFRGQGIGYQITQRLIDYLRDNTCKTLLLIATAVGEPLYKKLGFQIENYYLCFRNKRLNYSNFPTIIELKGEDRLDRIGEIDKSITNEKRFRFIKPFINRIITSQDDKKGITGFFIPDFAEGPIMAKEPLIGIELLKFKHSQKECKSIVPDSNYSAIKFFKENNFIKYDQVARMYYGKKIEWQPWNVYSRIGGFIG